jgi:hypothetical protein
MSGLRGRTMAGPPLVLVLVLLAAAPKGASGRPWNVTFGGCVFTGDTDGSPLVRQGSCPDQAGLLDLSHRNITDVPGTAFRCMTKIGFLNLSYNNIRELPWDVFADLTSLVELNMSNNGWLSTFEKRKQSPPSSLTDQEAKCYFNRYPDVQNVLEKNLPGTFPDSRHQDNVSVVSNFCGTRNIDTAKSHWIQYGKNEERDWSCDDDYDTLPENIFANLLSLKYLDMSTSFISSYSRLPKGSSYSRLPEGIFAGLNLSVLEINGSNLSCVPLTKDQKGALIAYDGPNGKKTCATLDAEIRREQDTVLCCAFVFSLLLTGFCLHFYLPFLKALYESLLKACRRNQYRARFKSLDTNGDGYISEKEFVRGWSTTPTTRLKWKDVGSEKPSTGTEIKNVLLAAALQKKIEFKKAEWDKFDVADLPSDSYIKAGNHYFKPVENIGYIRKAMIARGWSTKTTSSPQEDSTAAQDVMHLQWKDVGSEKPSTGTEVKNELLAAALQEKVQFKKEQIKDELLAAALQEKVQFKKEEWDKFHLANLSSDSYIKAGDCYFKPAESIVWKDEKWVDEHTGNPTNKKGKSSKDSKKSFWNKDSYSKKSHYPLKNFPFKWLDKDSKGQISREEYADGFELVDAFLQFEAGICLPLCVLLRAKYLNQKEKQKETPNIVGELGLGVSHPSPLPGTPSPAEIPRDGHSLWGGRCKRCEHQSAAPTCQKGDINTLRMGSSTVAAQGLRSAVGLDDDEVFGNMMKTPEITIECEILFAGLGGHVDGCIDDIDNYYSVKFGKSGDWEEKDIIIECGDDENGKAPIPQHVKKSAETGKYHGGDFKKEDYDKGNKGKKLHDFHNDPVSVLAGLWLYEVLILRLYTSTTYRLFNGPMRSLLTMDGQKSQHPLRFTIYALTECIKKLRAVEAKDDEKGFNTPKVLWRGMANMKLNEIFKSVGGTEMAVMSTTSDKEVAVKYAKSESALVFKYTTLGLTRGVKIQFLSLYPKEVEFVYPPLTFLSFFGDTEEETVTIVEEEKTVTINVTIVPVMPQMS